eukprot:447994_1
MDAYKLKKELLVFGYIRKQYAATIHSSSMSMPKEIMSLCFSFFFQTYKVLRFSSKYKSSNVLLTCHNKCIRPKRTRHCYALCDIKPVNKGKHCWRFQTKNPTNGWILYAVSERKKYSDDSYEIVYGMANCDQWFPYVDGMDYPDHNEASSWYFCQQKECEVDMLLDLNKRQIKYCIVGDTNPKHEYPILYKIPKRKSGWIPHINFHDTETRIRAAAIPIELFGVAHEFIFK